MTSGLSASGVTVRYGGVVALEDATLRADMGTVTALIGPNGAGKTTFFNACTGVIRPAEGSVTLGGMSLDGRSPSKRASIGLGRTFQRMALFDTMTTRENVAMGLECQFSRRTWFGQLRASRREHARCREAAETAMERCRIAEFADVPAGDLSTGQRRLVEFARALAADFRFLLLDEPSSGLDESETELFGTILTDVVRQSGTGILLVEHDMALVHSVCSYVYVLDFGHLVFEGTPAAVMSSEVVRAAYLGTEELA